MTFNFGEYKDWSTHGTWYSQRHPRWISCSMGWSILVFTSSKVINCILTPWIDDSKNKGQKNIWKEHNLFKNLWKSVETLYEFDIVIYCKKTKIAQNIFTTLHTLSWPTLQEHTIKARLQMFHEIVNNKIEIPHKNILI